VIAVVSVRRNINIIEEIDMYTYSEELFSDFHKEVYGFRPTGDHWFYGATPAEKQEIWDAIGRAQAEENA